MSPGIVAPLALRQALSTSRPNHAAFTTALVGRAFWGGALAVEALWSSTLTSFESQVSLSQSVIRLWNPDGEGWSVGAKKGWLLQSSSSESNICLRKLDK